MSARTPAPSLRQLRRRLTAWYGGIFGAILLALGLGLFMTLRRQYAAQLDASLHDAAVELERAARIREQEAGAGGHVVDAVDELHVPDRTLYLLDTAGTPVQPDSAPPWVRDVARVASQGASVDREWEMPGERTLRIHAERFVLGSGVPLVGVVVADRIELEDRYASLIAAFGAVTVVAIVMVAGGGWFLVRKSTTPVERSIAHMRRFMADAAHELRTPITVVRSRAEVALQQSRDREGYVEALRGIEAETARLGQIVDDLLTLARADSGEREIQRRRVFLDDVALDAAGAARVLAQSRAVELRVDEFEEAVLDGDATLLRQLVMILLDNALKFTPCGGRVSVRVGTIGERATLVVEDTGAGIPPEQLPHVFERFYRGDPARSRNAQGDGPDGTGLGLSIAQWIVSAHGGEIRVDSERGVGTRVSVHFPPANRLPHASRPLSSS